MEKKICRRCGAKVNSVLIAKKICRKCRNDELRQQRIDDLDFSLNRKTDFVRRKVFRSKSTLPKSYGRKIGYTIWKTHFSEDFNSFITYSAFVKKLIKSGIVSDFFDIQGIKNYIDNMSKKKNKEYSIYEAIEIFNDEINNGTNSKTYI